MAKQRTIASLAVSINATTRGLRRGLRRASNMVKSFAGTIGGVLRKGLGVLLGGAVAGGGAAFGLGAILKQMDDLAKTSRKFSIDPTPLTALRDAARESGVDLRTFDTAFQRILRRVQEASRGEGEAQSQLERLGLDAKELIKLAPEKLFEKLAIALDKASSAGTDIANVMKLADSEGVALVNTFRLIAEKGIKPFLDEVKRSGRDVTLAQLTPAENALDILGRLGQRVAGIFQMIGVQLAPTIERILIRFERFLNAKGVTFKIAKFIRDLGKELRNWERTQLSIKNLWEQINKAIETATQRLKSVMQFFDKLTSGINKAIQVSDTIFAARKELGAGLANAFESNEFVSKLTNAFGKAGDAMLQRFAHAAPDAQGLFGRLASSMGILPQAGMQGEQGKEVVDELKKQTQLLNRIDHGTDPRSLPKGTMLIQVHG